MPGTMDSRTNVLSGSSSYAIEKPAPIQVNAPLAQQTAQMGARPSEINYTQASTNARESAEALSNVNQRNLRAMSSISAFAQEKMKTVQEEQFADGYLRHMQGESVASIAKDKPFFGIFGDGAAVRGARTRQAENAGASILSYVEQNQGDLIKMSADEQRAALAKYTQDLSTGDAVADQMISAGAIKMFPAVLDNLSRASEAEQQRQAAVAQADTMAGHAQGLKYAASQVAQGQMAPEHYDNLKAQFIEASRPLPGQSPDSYRAAMTGNILSLAKDGNFEMANLLHDEVLSTMLTPAESMQMTSQMKQAQGMWLKDNPTSRDYTDFTTQLPVQIAAGRYNSEDAVYADIDRMNMDYKLQTGSVKPLIDNEERAKAGAVWAQNELKTRAANQKAAQAEQDEFAKRAGWVQGFAKGSPSQMAASGLDTKQKAALEQNETTKFFSEEGTASASTIGRLAVNGYTVAPLKEALDGTLGILKGGGIPKEEDLMKTQTAYLRMMNTPYGMGMAQTYFGDDLPIVKQMATMDMSKRENQQWIREQAQATQQPVKPSEETIKSANDLVDSDVKPGWWSRTFGDAQEMGAGFEELIRDDMKTNTARFMAMYPNMSQDDVLKMAAAKSMERKDVAGNMLITGGKSGEFFTTLNKHLNVKMQSPTDTRINTIFQDSIRAKVPEQFDFKVGSVNALPNGKLMTTVVRENGNSQTVILDIATMAEGYNNRKAEKTAITKEAYKSLRDTPNPQGRRGFSL